MSTLAADLVNPGACLYDGAFAKCALTPSDCGAGEVFLSASSARPNDPRCSVANIRSTPPFDVGTMVASFPILGLVGEHSGLCARDAGAPGAFDTRGAVCVWSAEDCAAAWPSGEAPARRYYAENPISAARPACRCDEVRTGACIDNKDPLRRYCAVQAEACGGGETFVRWRALEAATGPNLVCRLCAELPALPPPNPNPTAPPGSAPVLDSTGTSLNEEERGLSSKAIVGISVGTGGAILLLALLLKSALVWGKNKERGPGKDEGSPQETTDDSKLGGIETGPREASGLREDALRRGGFGGGGST